MSRGGDRPRALILSAPFGSGHRRAAEALGHAFEAAGARAEILDHFQAFVPAPLVSASMRLFWTLLRRAPALWGAAYRLSAHLPVRSVAMGGMDRLGARRLLNHVQATAPDLVVHTHPTPAGALAWLRERGRVVVPHAIVLTDFAAHPQWLYPGLDRYFVPCPQVAAAAAARGVPAWRITASGIPIAAGFGVAPDRPRSRRTLGLTDTAPVVLVVGGLRGALSGVTEVCRALAGLSAEFTALVACGGDQRPLGLLQRRLAGDRRFRVLGWIDAMPTLMGAADLVVTKAGGLTCAEALALGRPLVFHGSLPGQERANEALVVESGAGVIGGQRLGETLAGLLASPDRRAAMGGAARRLGRPLAARTVAEEMLAGAGMAGVGATGRLAP